MKDTKHKHKVITCINQTECPCIETKVINLRSLDKKFKNFIFFFRFGIQLSQDVWSALIYIHSNCIGQDRT